MSDILDDQKLHFIVKDYRRMYNTFWSLKEINQVLHNTINEKDKEILILRARVNELKNDLKNAPKEPEIPSGLKKKLGEMDNQINSIISKANKIMENVEDIRILTKIH
jgi:hypothetical protein